MAATSALPSTIVTRSRWTVQHLVVLAVAVIALSVATFAAGRASVDVHHAPAVTPAPAVAAHPLDPSAFRCRIGRPC
ncbi:MAG TPA: hypothetical protein VL119_04635 [Acidimicrobiia bacterium]|nr:hypothetical protein [Acidimicrobiia bacterium]